MSKIILSLIFLSVGVVFAQEPMGDYSFVCTTQNKTSALQIDGGTDPSGGFYIYFHATKNWKALNGESYMAQRVPSKSSVKFISVTEGTLKTTLTISKKAVSENVYKGTIKRKDLNKGRALNLLCTYL